MSRITKWKLDKTKVKLVFRLQFHATHIPQSGWDKLFISFIPADSGKATAKTTKANVRNGTCKWADPIYETTRLLQDAKSKQYDEKLYKLVVAMGSSRATILGEAIINLADYSDALKPSSVALPLHGCNSGTTLHVTIQLLTSKTGFREFEQQRELREKGLPTGGKHDESNCKTVFLQETATEQTDKDGARVGFRSDARELSSVEEEMGNEEYGDSAVGFDGSSNTSESLYAEKHDTSSAHEIDTLKSTFSGDMNGVPHCQSPHTDKVDPSDSCIMMAHGSSDSVQGWVSDCLMDNDLTMAYVENNRLRGSLEFAESSMFELKLEVRSLQSQADEIGIETQKFSHILATEISSCEEFAREVSLLKSECYKYKDDIERLRSFKLSPQIASSGQGHMDHYHLLQDIQLRWMKGILVVEDMIREFQSKIYLGFHERDSRFLHSELEALLNTLQDLKHGTGKAISLLNVVSADRTNVKENRETSLCGSEQFASGTGFDLEVCEPEIMLGNFIIPPLVSQETDSIGAIDSMRKHIVDLIRELEGAKVEKESLSRKMGQMECYYEALIQELEENQKQMLGELQNLRNEHSACLYEISTNKAEVESMRQNMNEQIRRLAEESRDLDALNKEFERRATTSQAALRRASLNYSIAVDKLQKDLELLSSQVLSMFETNENIIKQAFAETSLPPFPGYMNIMQNSEDSDAANVWQSQNQNMGVRKQLGGDVLLEDLKRSLFLQEELYQKFEQELMEMHSVNLHLDIFSRTLQQTLCEANSGIKLLKIDMDELVEKLRLSNESKDLLMVRLQEAKDDIHNLSKGMASCTAKSNDMAVQNQILEAKLESLSEENSLLLKKVADWEAIMFECRSYQRQYEACLAEKTELSILLKQESSASSKLQTEKSLLDEELGTLKTEISELNSLKENLEETLSFVQEKLASLVEYYDKHLTWLPLLTDTHSLDSKTKGCKDVVLQVEEIQHIACSKILQLMEENNHLESERHNAVVSISASKSEFLAMKQKFRNNMQDMLAKLDASSAVVEHLQDKLETVSNNILQISEVEDKYVEQQKEFLSDLAFLEVEIQNLMSKDGHMVQEILSLDVLAGECERNESTIAELIQEKQDFFISLQDKTVESAKLASEVSFLKENLKSLQDEWDAERGLKDKLESTVADLTSQLNKEQAKLQEFSLKNDELAHFRQVAIDLELEKSSLYRLLSECDEKLQAQSSCLIGLESELSDMREHIIAADVNSQKKIIAADVKAVFLISLHDIRIQELEQQLRSSDLCFSELQQKHQDLDSMLNCSLVNESRYTDRNAELQKTNESLRHDLEASVAQNRVLSDVNCMIMIQLEEYKRQLENLEVKISEDKDQQVNEVQELESKLENAKEETVNLILVKEQLDITIIYLKDKLDEQLACFTLVEEYKDELMTLNAKNTELANKLSQQILKSEFKNLTMHLKGFKDKADAENDLVLRICENKDQHVIEVEELRNKLANAEEETVNLTLAKEELEITIIILKDKLDEQLACITLLEECEDELMTLRATNSELANKLSKQILKTEEFKNLSIHLKELKDKADAECLLSQEKRESQGPSVAVQESLRIAFIKEQYEIKIQELEQKFAISKKHGEEMLLKLQDAVDEMESRKKSEALHVKRNEELAVKLLVLDAELQSLLSDNREKVKACDRMKAELECAQLSLECCKEEKEKLQMSLQHCETENCKIAADLSLTKGQLEDVASTIIPCEEESGGMDKLEVLPNESTGYSFPNSVDPNNLMYREKVEDAIPTSVSRTEDSNVVLREQSLQADAIDEVVYGTSEHAFLEGQLPQTHVYKNIYYLHTESVRSSINHLQEELERMKKDNASPDLHFNSDCQYLQNELMRLDKANAELRSLFPLYNEISSGGNALERVLALEIELAVALRAKHKSKINFQSFFLRQHSDEEAVLKSFRDINELIKEMLELKGRYASVEAELKEMHDRYSQLSLQFAEVEGDRQKLKMTLKNVRASRKFMQTNRS